MNSIKQQLYELCRAYVEKRILTARIAIQASQSSANEETKSSSGDKYETGRAMAQLDIEKNMAQLAEAQRLRESLSLINPDKSMTIIQNGSLVTTNQGRFFIAIPAGELEIERTIYFAISKGSPLAMALMGLQAGVKLTFNKKSFMIEHVE